MICTLLWTGWFSNKLITGNNRSWVWREMESIFGFEGWWAAQPELQEKKKEAMNVSVANFLLSVLLSWLIWSNQTGLKIPEYLPITSSWLVLATPGLHLTSAVTEPENGRSRCVFILQGFLCLPDTLSLIELFCGASLFPSSSPSTYISYSRTERPFFLKSTFVQVPLPAMQKLLLVPVRAAGQTSLTASH